MHRSFPAGSRQIGRRCETKRCHASPLDRKTLQEADFPADVQLPCTVHHGTCNSGSTKEEAGVHGALLPASDAQVRSPARITPEDGALPGSMSSTGHCHLSAPNGHSSHLPRPTLLNFAQPLQWFDCSNCPQSRLTELIYIRCST